MGTIFTERDEIMNLIEKGIKGAWDKTKSFFI